MLKQKIKGLNTLTVAVTGSNSDIEKLIPLLAGEVTKYKSVGSGGSVLAIIPNPLNKKVFVVGSQSPNGRISGMLTIPHVKTSSEYPELVADIKGKFDSAFNSDIKCEYAKLRFDA